MFFWRLAAGDQVQARKVVEQLRQQVVDLRWEAVSEVIHLTDNQCITDDRLERKFLLIGAGDTCLSPHEIIFFTACPPGDQIRPFGLAAYPCYVEGDSHVVPTHLGRWCWVGLIRSPALKAARILLQTATELGLEITVSE
jgi:hypothetical protein